MEVKKYAGLALFGCAIVMILLPGCLGELPGGRTNNQGGGNIFTAGLKVANNNLSSLTPDEVQILADFVMEQEGITTVDPITDNQAAAAVQFLQDNNINSIADIENLDPNTVVISDDVRAAIEAFTGESLESMGF